MMKYTEGSLGRVFVLRLEDGDPLNTTVEAFAREHGVRRGLAFYVGGGAPGTSLVVGPDATRTDAVIPLFHALSAPHETFAVGTLFPDEAGEPVPAHARRLRPRGRRDGRLHPGRAGDLAHRGDSAGGDHRASKGCASKTRLPGSNSLELP